MSSNAACLDFPRLVAFEQRGGTYLELIGSAYLLGGLAILVDERLVLLMRQLGAAEAAEAAEVDDDDNDGLEAEGGAAGRPARRRWNISAVWPRP